jgi:hypothetical protein
LYWVEFEQNSDGTFTLTVDPSTLSEEVNGDHIVEIIIGDEENP